MKQRLLEQTVFFHRCAVSELQLRRRRLVGESIFGHFSFADRSERSALGDQTILPLKAMRQDALALFFLEIGV